MYEIYLYLLFMGYHDAEQSFVRKDKENKPKDKKPLRWTKTRLAARYIRFADHTTGQSISKFSEDDPLWIEYEAQVRNLSVSEATLLHDKKMKKIEQCRKLYGWDTNTNDWMPVKNIHFLRQYLWQNGCPLFSQNAGPHQPEKWDTMFIIAYREASHYVHGSFHATRNSYDDKTFTFDDTRRYEPLVLGSAMALAVYSLSALADMVGYPELYSIFDERNYIGAIIGK